MMRTTLAMGLVALMLAAVPFRSEEQKQGDELLAKYKPEIEKGLEWLAKQQEKDGSWSHKGDFRVAMTSLAGLALLSEGSTPADGKYSKQIDKAVEFLVGRQQKGGLIGETEDANERHRYMFGHGFAITFLSQCYVVETSKRFRAEIEKTLKKAIEFTAKAQTRSGGWGYVSAADGSDFSENICTMPQAHSLYAAKKAGIPVPARTLADLTAHFKSSTVAADKDEAGVNYTGKVGDNEIREAATVGALASCVLGAVKEDFVVKWTNLCQNRLTLTTKQWKDRDTGAPEYLHFFLAQAAYLLGEDGHAKLAKDRKALLRWSEYRAAAFPALVSRQTKDGYFEGHMPVLATSVYLIILQLDKGHLPMCVR